MFEEFQQALRQMPDTFEIEIELPLDAKGYLDRTCSHDECRQPFKVKFEDWRNKASDVVAFCPKCGAETQAENYNTTEQKRYIKEVGEAYVAEQLNQSFSRAARRTPRETIGGPLFKVSMDVSYTPSRPNKPVANVAEEALRQDFQCEECGCRYSAVGAAYFCPACSHNSAAADFDQTIETTLKAVDLLDKIVETVRVSADADAAANIEQQMLEDQIENLVTALQRATECIFENLPNAPSPPFNVFQRIDHASQLWKQTTGIGYDDILTENELVELKKMVQRRHKFGHSQGMVDQRYIQNSGDVGYSPGQRLVVKRSDVRSLAAIVVKLVGGLRP